MNISIAKLNKLAKILLSAASCSACQDPKCDERALGIEFALKQAFPKLQIVTDEKTRKTTITE